MTTTTGDWTSSLNAAWHARAAAESEGDARLVDGFLTLLEELYRAGPGLERLARQYIAEAKELDRPAWVSAARSVWAMALWRAENEDSALLQLILAELDLQEEQRSPRQDPQGGPTGLAVASNNLGVAYLLMRMYELATPHLRCAAEQSEQLYAEPLHLQICADISNLMDCSLRQSLHCLVVGADVDAPRHAEEAAAQVERLTLWAQRTSRDDAARFARAIAIGARSVTAPTSLGVADREELTAIVGLPVFGAEPNEILLRSILARVCRLTGDDDTCRKQADLITSMHEWGDHASAIVARHEVALLEDPSSGAWDFARTLAQDTEVARRRTVTAFRARLAVAGLEQRYADASLERQRLQSALHKALQQEAALLHAATHDALTGLANRTLFEQRLSELLDGQELAAVAYLDIDDFGVINATHGHAAGDEVLRWVADGLRRAVREQDTVARLGGDEFGILLLSPRPPADLHAWAQRVLDTLHTAPDRPHGVGMTMGVCAVADGALTAKQALHLADAQMCIAKAEGKARSSVLDPRA